MGLARPNPAHVQSKLHLYLDGAPEPPHEGCVILAARTEELVISVLPMSPRWGMEEDGAGLGYTYERRMVWALGWVGHDVTKFVSTCVIFLQRKRVNHIPCIALKASHMRTGESMKQLHLK